MKATELSKQQLIEIIMKRNAEMVQLHQTINRLREENNALKDTAD